MVWRPGHLSFAAIGSNDTVYICDLEAIRKTHQDLGMKILDIDDDTVALAISDSSQVGQCASFHADTTTTTTHCSSCFIAIYD
jgi:hypothetical protein